MRRSPYPTNPPPSGAPTRCPMCGRAMKLTLIDLHPKFKNLDVRNFACDCGETYSDVIARTV